MTAASPWVNGRDLRLLLAQVAPNVGAGASLEDDARLGAVVRLRQSGHRQPFAVEPAAQRRGLLTAVARRSTPRSSE